MISIKKYLTANDPAPGPPQPEFDDLVAALVHSYRAVLQAIGNSAVRVCPAPGQELQAGLSALEPSLTHDALPKTIQQTQLQVEAQLSHWESLAADHLKARTNEVKDLLVMLARTAESVGERDQRYTGQLTEFTADLKSIASLDDLTEIRSSLVRKAAELKHCVDNMAQDGQQALAQLRSKVSAYEVRLKAVEQLAMKDSLTGLTNRRGVETQFEWLIAKGDPFCIVLLDLNLFKRVNDEYGHAEGDDLLRKFSDELARNVRSEDTVGRWGGDEFIIVLNLDLAGARSQISRIRDWVFGKYEIQSTRGKGNFTMEVTAAIGLAMWLPGKAIAEVLEEADASMYTDKRSARPHL